jgi:hypothetical protein
LKEGDLEQWFAACELRELYDISNAAVAAYCIISVEEKSKVKLSPLQAVEAYRVVRC